MCVLRVISIHWRTTRPTTGKRTVVLLFSLSLSPPPFIFIFKFILRDDCVIWKIAGYYDDSTSTHTHTQQKKAFESFDRLVDWTNRVEKRFLSFSLKSWRLYLRLWQHVRCQWLAHLFPPSFMEARRFTIMTAAFIVLLKQKRNRRGVASPYRRSAELHG